MERKGLTWLSHLKQQQKIWTKYMKRWFSRYQTSNHEGLWSWRIGKQNEMSSTIPSAWCLERVSRPQHGGGGGEGAESQAEASGHPDSRSWESEEIKVARVYRTEYQREDSCRGSSSNIQQNADKDIHVRKLPVLVHLGCYNKIPKTGKLINNRTLFLTVLDAGSLRSGCQHGPVRALPWSQTSHCILTWWEGLGSSVEPL